MSAPERLIALARQIIADQPYGCFSHPVALGVLIAADLVKGESGLPRHSADIPAAEIATEDQP